MSRQDEILAAAVFAGLAAGHAAAWGTTNREATHYGAQASDRIEGMRLNPEERAQFLERGLKRARQYIDEHVRSGALQPGDIGRLYAAAERELLLRTDELLGSD